VLSSPVFCRESLLLKPKRIILIKLCLVLYFSGNLPAQDSLRTIAPAAPDSAVNTRQGGMVMYWYDIHKDLKIPGDTTYNEMYREDERIGLNYVDFSDIFREEPLWFKFDLCENGRPAYVAGLNLFPQQTAYYLGGILMNDPINGMYNLQFIPLPFIRTTESLLSGATSGNLGMTHGITINMIPDDHESDTPWTRILYKQGGFGFSMLDISFVQSFSKKFTVQLGGYNNLYDGTLITANHDAQNFRGAFNWQYTPDIYLRGQFFLNRQKVGLATYETAGLILNPFQKENRDDYSLDFTWHPDPGHHTRLHTILYYMNAEKDLRADEGYNYAIKSSFHTYGVDGNFAFRYKDWEMMAGGGIRFPVIIGNAYTETYRPHNENIYGTMRLPFISGATLRFSGELIKQDRFSVQPGISAELDFHKNEHLLNAEISRSVRFPDVVDMYFSFDSLHGNPDLKPENAYNIHTAYTYSDSLWHAGIDWGYTRLENEIRWDGLIFDNRQARDFSYVGAKAGFGIWKILVSGGGQYTISNLLISPRSSAWGKLHFHDRWLGGALIVDGYLTMQFYDQHSTLLYDPRLERFYIGSGEDQAYSLLNWKAVATIQEARIFFEMDNALATVYQVINNYQDQFIRWRFGINWILWN
jgi:hypothetical protein